MALSKVTRTFRSRLGIREGDFLEVQERDGEIAMVPKRLIDADQAWFWTPEWQSGEQAVDQALWAGRVIESFESIEEMKNHFGDA